MPRTWSSTSCRWIQDSVPPEIVGYRDALRYVQQLADHPHFRYERMLPARACWPRSSPDIEEWLGAGRNTYDYYDVLAEAGGRARSPDRDTHAWAPFCLRAHHLQASSSSPGSTSTPVPLNRLRRLAGWPTVAALGGATEVCCLDQTRQRCGT